MKRNCDKCGEPPLIDGCCYDCSQLCPECGEDPMHFNEECCVDCKKGHELDSEYTIRLYS